MKQKKPSARVTLADSAAEAAVTRVLIPRLRAGSVARRRLLEFLHRHLDRRLELIVAPAGYGKTTLAAQFASEAREQDVPVCWLTLDAADCDVRSFFEHLLLSVQQSYPAFGRRTTALLRSVENASRERQSIATAFCNELVAEVDDFFLLVLDDFHTVTDSEEVCGVVDLLLQRMPEGAHILLSSRQIPTKLNLARLAARLEVAGLGLADLRFQLEETQELIRLRVGLDVPPGEARRAVHRSEGWVTGLLLALQGPDSLGLQRRAVRGIPTEPTYQFLATQVFESLPARMQRFLMESAVLPALSAAECAAVLRRSGTEALLDEVVQRGLFVEPLAEPDGATAAAADESAAGTPSVTAAADDEIAGQRAGPWLRYHQLWREFLLTRFATEDPARLAALRRAVARRAVAAGSPEVAVRYLLAGHDWGPAAQLLMKLGEAELAAGRVERLLGWIEQLPEEVLARAPVLRYQAARSLRRLDRIEESIRAAEDAERWAQSSGQRDVALLARVWRAEMLALLGQGDTAVSIVEEVFRSCGKQGLQGTLAVRLEREACITLGLAGRNAAAVQHGTAALRRLRSIADPTERAFIGAMLHHTVGICSARLDDAAGAARHYQQAAALWQRLGNLSQQSRVLNMQAALYHAQGNAPAARAAYEAALELAEDVGYVSTQVAVLVNLARLHREQRAFDEAREAVDRALPLARQLEERALLAEALQEAGALALQAPPGSSAARGAGAAGAAEAIHLLESALDEAEESWPTGEPLTRALLALAYARAHERAPATSALQQLEATAGSRAQGTLADARLRVEVARLAAQAALGQDDAAALRGLRRWARDRGRTAALYRECARYPETADLLLAQRGLPDEVTAQLTTALRQRTMSPPADRGEVQRRPRTATLHLVPLPESGDDFRVQLFGVPSMTRAGTPVRAWRAQLARELLFYFALHADRTVRTEALLDELLPEMDFDRALTALRYAVHQVRRLFAPLTPLQTEKNSYRFTLEPPIWCDAVEFQRLLAEATKLERPDRYAPRAGGIAAPAEAARAREAAVALYTGPLLDGFDAEWVLPLRAQMERQFLSAASALLDYYAGGKRHADAIHLAQHVLRLDPLQEEFHLAILQHQMAAGHLAAARQHFEYYRRLMRDELGQEPAEEALRLAEALQIGARSVGA